MCVQPLTITIKEANNTGGLRRVSVPCGKCSQCLKDYQNSWCVRISDELNNYGYAYFFTLTYRNSAMPCVVDSRNGRCFGTVYQPHVQNWLKRLRTRIFRTQHKKADIKYFITSEYGPRTKRPHYHGVIFGLSEIDIRHALHDWQSHFGFTSFRKITILDGYKSIRYVTKYCSKGVFENPLVRCRIVRPTFHLVSKGLGKSYIQRSRLYHLCCDLPLSVDPAYKVSIAASRRVVRQGQYTYKMPRYYKDGIFGSKSRLSRQIADYLLSKHGQLYDDALAGLQAEGHISSYEASRVYWLQNDYENLCREQRAFVDFAHALDKSKL